MKLKEEFNSKLLVEGNTDQHVIFAICEQHKIVKSFDVVDCKNDVGVIRQTPVRLKVENAQAVGIIIDADQDVSARWSSLSAILTGLGYTLPVELPFQGFIHLSHGIYPAVGIWIMPDNTSKGMIEDFARELIHKGDALVDLVDNILNDLEENALNRYNAQLHRSKAFIHTYLAWQEDPGTPIGLSITKH